MRDLRRHPFTMEEKINALRELKLQYQLDAEDGGCELLPLLMQEIIEDLLWNKAYRK